MHQYQAKFSKKKKKKPSSREIGEGNAYFRLFVLTQFKIQ